MRSLAIDPLPSHILILNGNQQKKREKKNTFCLPLSFSLYLYVIRPQQAVLPAVLQGVYLFLFCQKSSPGAKMNMKTSA